jgi:hypothetical protein
MKYFLSALALAFCCMKMNAQYRKSIPVKAGEDLAQAYSPHGFYRFAQFEAGALYSRSKSGNSRQSFNYNILSDKIQFINPQGDTLDMTNPSLFDSVLIGNTIFLYKEHEGFLEQLAAAGSVKLIKKTTLKIKPESIGAYGSATSTSSIDKIDTYVVGNRVFHYKVSEDMVLKQMIDWYWIGADGNLRKATRKNLIPLLSPAKAAWAGEFIKQQKIDFDKEADLVRLVQAII